MLRASIYIIRSRHLIWRRTLLYLLNIFKSKVRCVANKVQTRLLVEIFFFQKFFGWSHQRILCCIFRPALLCCALQMLVEILVFNNSCAKRWKMQKVRNLLQNLAKKLFFKFAPKCWSKILFPEKNRFHPFLLKKVF